MQGLRESAVGTSDIADAIGTLGAELAGAPGDHPAPAFHVTVEGEPRPRTRTVWSQEGAGTAVELCIPSRSAYVKTLEPRCRGRSRVSERAPRYESSRSTCARITRRLRPSPSAAP